MADKVSQAINLLQLGSRMSLHYYKQPLLICNSGGKDSLVLLELARRAGRPRRTATGSTQKTRRNCLRTMCVAAPSSMMTNLFLRAKCGAARS